MPATLLPRYADCIARFTTAMIAEEVDQPSKLLMQSGICGRGKRRLDVAYAPFDYVNERARGNLRSHPRTATNAPFH